MLSGGFIAAVCLCVAFLAVASSKLGTSVQHSGNGGKLADAWHAQMLSSAQKLVPQPQGCLQNCLASCARKRNSYFDHDLVQTAECNRFCTTHACVREAMSVQHSGTGGKFADVWHAEMLSSAQELFEEPQSQAQGCLQNCLASCARRRNSYFNHDLVQTAECNRFCLTRACGGPVTDRPTKAPVRPWTTFPTDAPTMKQVLARTNK